MLDVLNGVASVLTIVGFVLCCTERFVTRRKRQRKNGQR